MKLHKSYRPILLLVKIYIILYLYNNMSIFQLKYKQIKCPLSSDILSINMFVCRIVCFILQGHFNTWLDSTPVSVTNWYKPHLFSKTQFHLLDVYNGEVIKTNELNDIFTFNSNHYFANNWSAIAPYKIYGAYVWVDIPCNKTMNAWYVCQTVKKKQHYKPQWQQRTLVMRAGFW